MVRDDRTAPGFPWTPWTSIISDAATLQRLRVIETATKFVVGN